MDNVTPITAARPGQATLNLQTVEVTINIDACEQNSLAFLIRTGTLLNPGLHHLRPCDHLTIYQLLERLHDVANGGGFDHAS